MSDHLILVVDDEESILKALRRVLQEVNAKLVMVSSGQTALDVVSRQKVTLIISDQRMPEMTGVELLSKVRELSPETIRILLTGYADVEATVDAINNGAVRYYMNKPWDDDLLISRINDSLELYDSTAENRHLNKLTRRQNEQLLEFNQGLEDKVVQQTAQIKKQHDELKKSLMGTIKAFSTIVGLRLKSIASHSHRVAMLVTMLLKGLELSEKEYQDIVVAAYLHDIGKIGLPDKIAEKDQDECSSHEKKLLYKHPILGQSCICSIVGFDEIALIIRHHHENFNGTGYPDCLIGQKIPLGSRILRICDAFDHNANRDEYPNLTTLDHATALLQRRAGSEFDPKLLRLFTDLDIASQYYSDDSQGVIGVKPTDLKKGMVVAMDIRTVNDVFLLPKGAKLSTGMIARISRIHAVDPIIEAIRVYSSSTNIGTEHVTA